MLKERKKIIISGGGTGGHVYPAIAIANELKRTEPEVDILFVGAKGKLEMEKVPQAGYPIEGLWISGFHRKLTLRNLLFPVKLLHSLWRAYIILRRFKPDLVVGVGGFASGPTLEIASRMGIPTLIQEQNSYPGVTNRLLAKKVDRICVAYEGMQKYFPADKIIMTGNPVRTDIFNLGLKKKEALGHFGLDPSRQVIFLTGGSLGARSLNMALRDNSELLKGKPEIQVLWQVGRLYVEDFKDSQTARLPNVKILAFVDRMDLAFAAADVIISRAGASTVSELCAVGKPVVLVPSPNVAEDHQTDNANALVKQSAAIMVRDKDASAEIIDKAIDLLEDKNKYETLSANILKMARPDAAQDITKEILSLLHLNSN